MANSTISPYQGACVAPFLDESKFPAAGGFVGARLCIAVEELPGRPSCCLPCPATDWLYADSFKTNATVSQWLNVFGLVLLLFMLISYAVLPPNQTRRHYLSTCLVIAVGMIALGFIVPLGVNPEQCYDAITPNDMYSSLECAFSGALIMAGGLSTITWVLMRALSMHLQICWDIVPGKRFMYASQLVGWGLPIILFIATMAATGVSFRFGKACHINHENGIATVWGPLLAQAAIAGFLQISTFGYCIRVYLKSLWGQDAPGISTNASNGGLPSYTGSLRAQTTRAVFKRLQKVLFLQWRGLGIVSIILIDVIFFSVTFVRVDKLATEALNDFNKTAPWINCLVVHPNDKNQCLSYVNDWLVNVETVEAVLMLLALAGLQCFLLMTRPSFFTAWYELFRRPFKRRQEFRPLDTTTSSTDKQEVHKYEQGHTSTTFEMQKPGFPADDGRSSDDSGRISWRLDKKTPIETTQAASPLSKNISPVTQSPGSHFATFGKYSPPVLSHPSPPAAAYVSGMQADSREYFVPHSSIEPVERHYQPPLRSFSAARPPSRDGSMRSQPMDARESFSRNYRLNSTSEAEESEAELVPHRQDGRL